VVWKTNAVGEREADIKTSAGTERWGRGRGSGRDDRCSEDWCASPEGNIHGAQQITSDAVIAMD
jgi:hypothetical protein